MTDQIDFKTQLADLETKASLIQELSINLIKHEEEARKQLKILMRSNPDLTKALKALDARFPREPSFLLHFAMGKKAPFTLRPFAKRIEYKKEYELFKLRMSLISLALACLCYFIPFHRFTDAMYSFAMLYMYSTLTLREQLLIGIIVVTQSMDLALHSGG